MGHQVIKQPNGKYAVFSTVVDSFTVVDATREQLLNYYIDKAKKDEEERVNKLIDEIEAGKNPYYQFAYTYKEALKSTKRNYPNFPKQ